MKTACMPALFFICILFSACCNEDSDCDDGIFCNGEELCIDFLCRTGEPPDCDDGVDCTQDRCDEDLDACVSEPDDAFCDDGLFCNGPEVCDIVLGCVPGTAPDCNDGIDCTHDRCDEELDSCVNEPDDTLCADDLFCTTNERCDPTLGGCVVDEVDCNDSIECTDDFCDEENDVCVNDPDDSLCDDGNECTQNICNPEYGCEFPPVPDGTPCGPPDGSSICVDGVCVSRMCGDGYVEPLDSEFLPEECDDGNDDDTDGCTSLCRSQDFQVNTTEEGEEKNPSVAISQDGGFIIVFEDETYTSPLYTDVRFRRYDNHGTPADPEDRLLSDSVAGIQIQPDAAALPGGGFAAAWADNSGAGDLFDIKFRMFDEAGIPSPEITVNDSSFGSQLSPKVSCFHESGNVFVLWEDQAALEGEIYFRRYDTSGFAVDTEARSVSSGMLYQGQPNAAEDSDGRFLVVWTGSDDGAETKIYARLYNSAAEPAGDIIEIPPSFCYQNYDPHVAWTEGTGHFVVVWERLCHDSFFPETAATIIDPDDSSIISDPITISPATEENFTPVVTAAHLLAVPAGSFDPPTMQWIITIAWSGTSTSAEPADAPYDIFGQRYTIEAAGLALFDPEPTVLATINRFEQTDPAGAFSTAGNLIITWTDYSLAGSDASCSSIRGRYLPNGWLLEE